MKIINTSKNTILADHAEIADTVLSRLIGLLNRSALSPREALVITQCRAIHMFFMRFPIDAVFVGKDNRVVGLVEGIQPFRISPYFLKASYVIELPAGTIKGTATTRGDIILLQ